MQLLQDPTTDIQNPRYARQAAKALARSQRNSASKVKGSKNHKKAKKQLSKISAKITNQRRDFHHKAARDLVNAYDSIGIEDLKVKNMSRKGKGRCKSGLNRSISDAGWSQFRKILIWQATKTGKQVVVLPAKNTTQKCSSCAAIAKPRIELSDRVFNCKECGLVLDRDRNAARNLNPVRTTGVFLGGAKPKSIVVPVDDDSNKTKVCAQTTAA